MNDFYLQVLQQYDGEILEIRRGRGAWLCQRQDGWKLLREYRGSMKRLEFEETVLQSLKDQGICYVDQCIRNRDGMLLTVAEDGTKYVLKDWFLDRECSIRDKREVLTAVEHIARLHRAMGRIAWQEAWDLASMQSSGLWEEMCRHSREMKRVRSFIHRKRKKNPFEMCVMRHFASFYQQAIEAQEGMEQIEQEGQTEPVFLCHGDLNQHHILMRGEDVAFTEFSQMHRGEQMADLYHFMRKVMEKHNWDVQLGLDMITAYHQVQPIADRQRKCLYYLFLYPEKYWKQLNYYNNANKAWIPEKNIEKLWNLEQQQEKRQRFLEKIK